MEPRTDKFDIVYFQEYVETYRERYPDDQNIMFLDMLYGIGISIDSDKYRGADGFRKFIEWIGDANNYKKANERYKKAITSLVSEESAGKEWNTKLNHAFQIAAFGEIQEPDPNEDPDDSPEGWLQNRNHGG